MTRGRLRLADFDPADPWGASFKAPSSEELDHDFLWRTSRLLPRRGHIGIFNRSRPHSRPNYRPA